MKNKSGSPWTTFLDDDFQDPYQGFKKEINKQIETLSSLIENALIANNAKAQEGEKTYTPETAKKMAIHLITESVLKLEHTHSPQALAAMTAALVIDLPELAKFREEIYEYKNKETNDKKPELPIKPTEINAQIEKTIKIEPTNRIEPTNQIEPTIRKPQSEHNSTILSEQNKKEPGLLKKISSFF